MTTAVQQPAQQGFYSSTADTYFADKDSLAQHYKSDFHRYNLQRKVHISTNKYKDLVRASGQPAPAPVVSVRRASATNTTAPPAGENGTKPSGPATHTVKTPTGVDLTKATGVRQVDQAEHTASEGEVTDESEWETDSEAEAEADLDDSSLAPATPASRTAPAAQQAAPSAGAKADGDDASGEEDVEGEEWDVKRSLFDNRMAGSMEGNLEYMWKHYGFYFPDAEYLKDPEGLLKYLGAKLQYGVPLYRRGDDENAKQFSSLHAVQRHMVDTNQCKMAFDDNEEEYDDFYDWSALEAEADAGGKELVVVDNAAEAALLGTGGFELVLPGAEPGQGKILGSREFARYYRQRHRPAETRQSVAINKVLSKYRLLGVALSEPKDPEQKRVQKLAKQFDRINMRTAMRGNVNRNLPRNVTY
ncbi:hypothetical protein WJX72_002352 [[Myrmecia] bisecta]|uniref:ZN622/Rei1/Reh1 zinc finger C2H2-type domain-containing protein n=1 Tax=[Myrmecia] bisecta TaxID=41462 RepID=A0AAW1R508_9CHLO